MFKISRANKLLKLFGLFKIPLIGFVNPKVVELDNEKVVVKIKKNWRTRNHFNSMYFGSLAIGGDIAAGFLAFLKGKDAGINPSLAFKSYQVEFFKRPDYDVFFVCNNGKELDEMFQLSKESGERITRKAPVQAYTNYYSPDKELVAEMILEVSIKVKS